jgi:hypothetical protein
MEGAQVGRSRTDNSCKCNVPATGTAALGSMMTSRSPRNLAKMERAPFAEHYESLPIGPGYRSVDTLQLRTGVTLRDLIERKGRDHEGT